MAAAAAVAARTKHLFPIALLNRKLLAQSSRIALARSVCVYPGQRGVDNKSFQKWDIRDECAQRPFLDRSITAAAVAGEKGGASFYDARRVYVTRKRAGREGTPEPQDGRRSYTIVKHLYARNGGFFSVGVDLARNKSTTLWIEVAKFSPLAKCFSFEYTLID